MTTVRDHRLPGWGWALVLAGGLWVLAVVTAAGLALAGAAVVLWGVPTGDGTAACQEGLGTECTDLAPDVIGDAVGMVLPEGTVVESSQYTEFQDWSLEATFVVPADKVALWEASLAEYTETDAATCTGLEGRGNDRRCGEVIGAVDPYRSYVRATTDDGSVVVSVHAFTT